MNSNALKLFVICCALFGHFLPCTFGNAANAVADCPSWEQVHSRTGSDGGQLTIALDLCQVFGYSIYSLPQADGTQLTPDLIPDDLIVVWDEDIGHGDQEEYKNFTFTGSYVPDPNNNVISLSTTDLRTNWSIYRVTESGTFAKGENGTNEHELIHFYNMLLQKVDDVNDLECRGLGDEINYTICYQNISDQTLEDIILIDWLPEGVTYPPGEQDPNYNSEEHFYVWELGVMDPNDSGCVELRVLVNDRSNPTGILHNVAELRDNELPLSRDVNDTKVCCWGGDTIYVDQTAPGPHTGTSWQTAYTDLQSALQRAAKSCANRIYIADGIYKPGLDTASSFGIPQSVSVYGSFGGFENDPNQRDLRIYRTVLNGYIGKNDFGSNLYNNTVVKMSDGTLLDGILVENGIRGIDGSGATSVVRNCVIQNNTQRGIYVENGDLTVQWSDVLGNGFQGIHHLSDTNYLVVENCQIHDNVYDGIRTVSSAVTIRNSFIYQNGIGSGAAEYYGINLLNPFIAPLIRNNTIVQNANAGIHFTGLNCPDIINSIVYYNGGSQLAGIDPDSNAYYSCISDCNDINNNFNDPPGFAYMIDPNHPAAGNYHLAYNARCVDAGDRNFYTAETDIDGEPRIFGTWVDVGADEAFACGEILSEEDIYNPLDWNADGLVNYDELMQFSSAWLSHDPNDPVCDPNNLDYIADPNDPGYITLMQKLNWKPVCNLAKGIPDSMYVIDLYDFEILCNNWAWMSCWKRHQFDAGWMPLSGQYSISGTDLLNSIQLLNNGNNN